MVGGAMVFFEKNILVFISKEKNILVCIKEEKNNVLQVKQEKNILVWTTYCILAPIFSARASRAMFLTSYSNVNDMYILHCIICTCSNHMCGHASIFIQPLLRDVPQTPTLCRIKHNP